MLYRLGEDLKAKEHVERALAIATKIGDKKAEASCCENLGALLQLLGECDKAKQYLNSRSGNTTRLKSISKKRLSPELKLATGKERQLTTET